MVCARSRLRASDPWLGDLAAYILGSFIVGPHNGLSADANVRTIAHLHLVCRLLLEKKRPAPANRSQKGRLRCLARHAEHLAVHSYKCSNAYNSYGSRNWLKMLV